MEASSHTVELERFARSLRVTSPAVETWRSDSVEDARITRMYLASFASNDSFPLYFPIMQGAQKSIRCNSCLNGEPDSILVPLEPKTLTVTAPVNKKYTFVAPNASQKTRSCLLDIDL